MAVDKRAALLEAAEAVFVERGMSRATVDEITVRAGVAKGTFYLYFRSKDEVVQALQGRLWQGHVELAADAAARLVGGGEWWEAVDRFLEDVIDYDLAHREWHRIAEQSGAPPLVGSGTPEQEIIDLVTMAIEAGIAQGTCHSDDPPLTATLLYRACQGTSHQVCVADDEPDRERLVAAVKAFVRKALAVPAQ